jgi:LuxR family maltose regulon positive regulatory protein
MAGQLIKTKASIPRRVNLLSRNRLLDFLQRNIHRKLTLVCASPGYGKTSLLVDFAHNVKVPVCWYTLDSTDEDPSNFLDYVIEAVRAYFPGFGEQARTLLRQGQTRDLRSLVGLIINDLANIAERRVVLVLDEYHTIGNADAVHRVLDLFLEFLPSNVHLIVASRSIPPAIRLIRLAARGEVGGLGTDDLRFTEEEVRAVLELQFGMALEKVRVHELTEHCEGWITGILLGTQSVWQNLMGFLENMPGPERVYDYLLAEVLDELPVGTRDFLVRVSILNRLEASLCNDLLDLDYSDEVLEWLERRNIFLVPLAGGCAS